MIETRFFTGVDDIEKTEDGFIVVTGKGDRIACRDVVLAPGRSGSRWMSEICEKLHIKTMSNRVDIGVRVELPAEIFKHITDDVYESKLVYKTDRYNDVVRTFCMNPYGEVVAENTNGIITVNGHSYADEELRTENTNFALLVTNQMTEPFNDSNEYGESIARLSNLLGGGVLMQRFGDLVKGTEKFGTQDGKMLYPSHAESDAGRSEPRHSEAAAGQHYRDDLRSRQDRAGYGQRGYAALRRRGEIL